MKKSIYLLVLVLSVAAFLRLYRTGDFLGFWYDQGRDALVVWDFIHNGNWFLIGPTTGIEGIFLGPFYYYLITPLYALGSGNPVYPAVFLVLINLAAMTGMFFFARRYYSQTIALLAVVFIGLSYEHMIAHRWLSNPTPLPLFALLTFWSLIEVIHGRNRWWWLLGLAAGLSLQLEAASAVWFLPVILIALFVNRSRITAAPTHHKFLGLGLFLATLLPQLLFDFRNDHILLKSFQRFLLSESSFRPSLTDLFQSRLQFYYQAFTSKFMLEPKSAAAFFISILILAYRVRRLVFTRTTRTLVLWIMLPAAALLFYHGNNGYVWDYYFTGVYPMLALLVAVVLITAYKSFSPSRGLVLLLIAVFLYQNLSRSGSFLSQVQPAYISLAPVVAVVDWVFNDASDSRFNTDVYVPPMIPLAYDYIFRWRGTTEFNRLPDQQLTTRLYTIHEPDPGHMTLLNTWLARQASIGSIEVTRKFGPITVERRHRFSLNP